MKNMKVVIGVIMLPAATRLWLYEVQSPNYTRLKNFTQSLLDFVESVKWKATKSLLQRRVLKESFLIQTIVRQLTVMRFALLGNIY
jgi:hypothetical protein